MEKEYELVTGSMKIHDIVDVQGKQVRVLQIKEVKPYAMNSWIRFVGV